MNEKLSVDEIRILKGCLEEMLRLAPYYPDITLGKDDIELWEKLERIVPHEIPGRAHSRRKVAEEATGFSVS